MTLADPRLPGLQAVVLGAADAGEGGAVVLARDGMAVGHPASGPQPAGVAPLAPRGRGIAWQSSKRDGRPAASALDGPGMTTGRASLDLVLEGKTR